MTTTCRRCRSRSWWKSEYRGRRFISCLACGFEPSRAAFDARHAAELRAERNAKARVHTHRGAGALSDHQDRAIAALYEGAA